MSNTRTGGWSDLWDQSESLSVYTLKGIEYLEKVGSFAFERAAIEDEYAKKLKALARKVGKRSKDEDELWKTVTFVKGFTGLLGEVDSLASQHELIADSLRKEVVPFVATKANQLRASRKQALADLSNVHSELNGHIAEMNKSHKNYGKSFKEAEAAHLKYVKAEKNMELSRLDLEKAKNNSQMRNHMCEEAKQSYASTVYKANQEQTKYFDDRLPSILEKFRSIDMERINDTRDVLYKCIGAEVAVRSVIAKCHEDMRDVVASIDPNKDGLAVVENFKTGIQRPGSFDFEDLGRPEGGSQNGDRTDGTLRKGASLGRNDKGQVARKQSMRQKFFGGGSAEKKPEIGDYGTLPPQQRARKLIAKINELEKEREKSLQSREGVSKMQAAYRENPKLGNPDDCEPQLMQYAREIDSLGQQVAKYRALLDDVNAQLGLDSTNSLRSASSLSSVAPRSGSSTLDARRPSSSTSSAVSDEHQSSNALSTSNGAVREEIYEECDVPLLGKAIAQFKFEVTTDGTIAMDEGEEVLLVERDEGDGWTRVRRADNSQEGFVPSSYLSCTWY